MASSVAAGRRTGRQQGKAGRTPAQWYCYLAGAGLLLAGIFGFFADSTFDTGSSPDRLGGNVGGLQGDSFLGLEVNGWHNVVHIASGLFLLAMAGKRRTAKPAALAFGVVYGLVAIIGLIDGNDVLGFIPINKADNVLHILLSLAGILAAVISRTEDDHVLAGPVPPAAAVQASGRTVRTSDAATTGRTGTGRTLEPEDHDRTRDRR